MREVKISPSIFAADLSMFREQIEELERNHAELLHIDVMDGHFVERMAFGADHIHMIKKMTNTPLDVHLMIDNPEEHIESVVNAGADIITIHQESTTRLLSCMQKIRKCGVKAGVVLSPATSEDTIRYLLDDVDMILLMTVNPGEGGQHFLTSVVEKIRRVNEMIGERDIDLEVDGSIDDQTIRLCREAGANVFVSGGYLFKNITKNMDALRKGCNL